MEMGNIAAQVLSVGGPLVGSLFSAGATLDQGNALRKEKYYEATQMDQKAREIEAKGSHSIEDNALKYEILISKAIAINGAGGGGGSDPTFMKMIANLGEEGERTTQRVKFGYKSESAFFKEKGAATRYEGDNLKKASRRKGLSTLLTGAGKAATNFLADGQVFSTKRLTGFG